METGARCDGRGFASHRFPVWRLAFSHLVRAALRAISLRCSGVSLEALALPPFRPQEAK